MYWCFIYKDEIIFLCKMRESKILNLSKYSSKVEEESKKNLAFLQFPSLFELHNSCMKIFLILGESIFPAVLCLFLLCVGNFFVHPLSEVPSLVLTVDLERHWNWPKVLFMFCEMAKLRYIKGDTRIAEIFYDWISCFFNLLKVLWGTGYFLVKFPLGFWEQFSFIENEKWSLSENK